MKNEIKELFMSLPGTEDRETAEKLLTILDLPNEQFEVIYPSLKEELEKIYESEHFQKQMISQMELTPFGNPEEEKIVIEEILNEIKSDEGLSSSKKELLELMFNSVLDTFNDMWLSRRQRVKVKILKLNSDAVIPEYAHPSDAGADICAVEDVELEPKETKIVKTGLAVAIPDGYEIQVRPRSGLSLKSKLRIANATGTIKAA